MSELDANVVGALIIVACVVYAVWMLKSAENDGPWPW